MFTSIARHLLCCTVLLAAGGTSAVHAQEPMPTAVRDYDLFVDLPTAYAFVKLPTGWKFVGKLDAGQLRQLPPGTLTSLLPPEDSATRLAGPLKARPGKG